MIEAGRVGSRAGSYDQAGPTPGHARAAPDVLAAFPLRHRGVAPRASFGDAILIAPHSLSGEFPSRVAISRETAESVECGRESGGKSFGDLFGFG